MKQISTYNYTPKPILALFSMLLFFGMSYLGVVAALGNERGVRLFGIAFSSTVTNSIIWIFVAITIYLGIKLLFAFVNGLKGGRKIILSETTLMSPKSVLSPKSVTIKLSDIRSMNLQKNSGKLFLHIEHANGKLVIPSVVFDELEAFHDLAKRLNEAKHTSG